MSRIKGRGKLRSEAILIKLNEGRSFTKVLRERNNAKAADAEVNVKSIRQTRTSDLLAEFWERVQSILGTEAVISLGFREPICTLEVRDLCCVLSKHRGLPEEDVAYVFDSGRPQGGVTESQKSS